MFVIFFYFLCFSDQLSQSYIGSYILFISAVLWSSISAYYFSLYLYLSTFLDLSVSPLFHFLRALSLSLPASPFSIFLLLWPHDRHPLAGDCICTQNMKAVYFPKVFMGFVSRILLLLTAVSFVYLSEFCLIL